MKLYKRFIFVAMLMAALIVFSGCDEATEDAAEDALEDLTGFPWDIKCDKEYEGPDDPDKWVCMFAVKLDADQADLLNGEFSVPVGDVADLVGLDLDTEYQVVFAKLEQVEGSARLQFANKIKVEDGDIILDTEATEKLGDSAGAKGAGWYGAYFASEDFGFLHGEVENCDGAKESGVLVVASDGPFFTYTAGDGSWAVPSLNGKPATVYFSDGDDCSGSSSDPVTDEDNPKSEDPADTPDNDEFGDGTDNVDAGDDEMGDPGTTPMGDTLYDFEDGTLQGFVCTGAANGVDTAEYATLFPDGGEANYMYLSSGGSQNPSTTCSATFQVPDGVTEVAISYDFFSQEWEEWAFSPYNDIFTVIIQGEFDYVINRTIDNTAVDDDWADVALDIAGVGASADAQFNATGAVFDGHLKWNSSPGSTPRGGVEDDMVGQVATYPIEAGSTVTLLLTVSDVGDKIYDSGAAIDWVELR